MLYKLEVDSDIKHILKCTRLINYYFVYQPQGVEALMFYINCLIIYITTLLETWDMSYIFNKARNNYSINDKSSFLKKS